MVVSLICKTYIFSKNIKSGVESRNRCYSLFAILLIGLTDVAAAVHDKANVCNTEVVSISASVIVVEPVGIRYFTFGGERIDEIVNVKL